MTLESRPDSSNTSLASSSDCLFVLIGGSTESCTLNIHIKVVAFDKSAPENLTYHEQKMICSEISLQLTIVVAEISKRKNDVLEPTCPQPTIYPTLPVDSKYKIC